MKGSIVWLLVILFWGVNSGSAYGSEFWWKKKKKEIDTEKEAKSEKSAYDKLFEGAKRVTDSAGFITLHKVKDKLYFEFPLKYMGREMLLASTVSRTTDPMVGIPGYKPEDPLHIKFTLQDSSVCLHKINTDQTFDGKDRERMQKIKDQNFGDPIDQKFKVLAYNRDSSAVVFDMTDLFTRDEKTLNPLVTQISFFNIMSKAKPALTALKEFKSFPDNVTIKTSFSYDYSLVFFIFSFGEGSISVDATRTLLLLPEEKMHPRIADSRIGVFLTQKTHLSDDVDRMEPYAFANRWRLEPKGIEAYKKGELVEPVKPIIFYLDDAFPILWKEPIREGAMRWNKAFEKIGFKNVIQVLDFPKNDPGFDPDNLKYSCIRYVPAAVENAMGPSWVDPSTGEIINASVLVYNDVIKLINNWRFVQTAQVDPSVRNKKMPDDIVRESIAYVVAHEVGHCLGLMHNMAASAAYPVDSLRSASFTSRYGTTPSIMDYARFNYVVQPGDKNVRLTPPDLGIYDEYAIKWLYQPLPDAGSVKEEIEILEKWVDEKAGDPRFRYGKQQVFGRFDPSAIEEDLGNDPVKAGTYGVKNLKYVTSHMDKWIANDGDVQHRTELYSEIMNQYYRYVTNVLYNVGGVYLSETKDGTSLARKQPVSKETQRASVKWVLKEMKSCSWLDDKTLTDKFKLSGTTSSLLVANIIRNLFYATPAKVVLASSIADGPYSLSDFFDDLYTGVWEGTIQNRSLNPEERQIQNILLARVCDALTSKPGDPARAKAVAAGETDLTEYAAWETDFVPYLDEMRAYGLVSVKFTNRYMNELQKLEKHYGKLPILKQLKEDHFGEGYDWQRGVNVKNMDESTAYFISMGRKMKTLLESRIPTAGKEDKVHYQSMLFQLNNLMDGKK